MRSAQSSVITAVHVPVMSIAASAFGVGGA
jgi:hypothetical protein